MSVKNMPDLLLDALKDIYDAEKRITKALPKMKRAAESEELIAAFDYHLRETEEQVKRLERIFGELDETAKGKVCQAMVGLLKEGDEVMEEVDEGPVRDAALIAAAQKVEHYEIATYGCLRDWARKLGHDSVVRLVQETLDEEGAADKRLSQIAQSLNVEAIKEGDEDEEEEETTGSSRRMTAVASRGGATKRSSGSSSRGRSNGGRSKR